MENAHPNRINHSQRKILGVEWRSGKDSVGIVAVEQSHNKRWRAYIGVAQNLTENSDAKHIADWGAKLNRREALAFFPYLDPDKFDDER